MIESLANTLSFLDVDNQYFEITGGNDILVMTSSEGGPRNIDVADGTYDGDGLATALATAMNADATLTGGTITFAVTYSSTTFKYTIDATAGNTIAYTNSGSDAAYTFGFNTDQAAAQTITSDFACGDPTAIVQSLLTETEEYIATYCRRTFESTSYTKERFNGNGYPIINLEQYPATVVDRVAVGLLDVISIKNTSSGTYATVSVDTTGLRLMLDGTADATVTFASYTTMTTLVAAVNALGSGWSATLLQSSYGSFLSTELVTRSAASCIDSRVVYLSMPDIAESSVTVNLDLGQIRLSHGFSAGWQNVFVDYTAGYSDAAMPDDLKLAVKIIVQTFYERRGDASWGLELANVGASGTSGMRNVFDKAYRIPKEAKDILERYKRHLA